MIQINLFTKEQQIHRLSKWTCVSRREEWGERGLFYTPSHIRATCYFLPSEWNFSPSLELAPFQITKTYLALTIYFVFITSQYYRACHSILPSCVCVCVCVCFYVCVSVCIGGEESNSSFNIKFKQCYIWRTTKDMLLYNIPTKWTMTVLGYS